MIRKTFGLPLACIALGALALGRPPQATQAAQRSLADAVPGDVFLFTHGRHNPAHDFVDAHWAKVWEAFKASGVIEDLTGLLMGVADEDQRANMEHLHERFTGLIGKVDWAGLVGGESAFGERMPGLQFLPGGGVTAIPEYVVLMRPAEGADVDAIHAGIQDLMKALTEEVKNLGGVELPLVESQVGEVHFLTLSPPVDAGVSFTLGRQGRTILFCMGKKMQEDVGKLLSGSSDLRPVSASERMRKTLARLPQPEDGLTYFDMVNLRGNIESMLSTVFEKVNSAASASGQSGGDAQTAMAIGQTLSKRLLDTLGILQSSATVTSTRDHSTFTQSVTVLAPDAEQNAFFPVLKGGGEIADFSHWLPKETTNFAVDAGISPQALYGFIEDTVRQLGPMGEMALSTWEGYQDQVDFDVHEDLLDWMGSTSVQASMQFEKGSGWILLSQVLDDEKARDGLDWALEIVPKKLTELAAQVPPLAMLGMRVSPNQNPELEGFHDVGFGMMPTPIVCGVRDGWLMLGTQEALLASIHTAAGDHESLRDNKELMAKLLVPDGPIHSIHFTDHSKDGEEIAQVLGVLTMVGGMATAQIPDPEGKQVATQLLGIVGKLGPVVSQINFYDSAAGYTRFDGKAYTTHSVMHYVPPPAEEDKGEGGL